MKKPISHTSRIMQQNFGIYANFNQYVIALAGNPNVGKSTIFNALTGLRQHTGNWPGKTVDNAQGFFTYRSQSFLMVDLPGTYSLLAHTIEEQVARDFICFGRPDATLLILDATCLERNLNLALQVMEITTNIIVCLNLIDEARKKNIKIDIKMLEEELGVPVVATAARTGEGIDSLLAALYQVASGSRKIRPYKIVYSPPVEKAIAELEPAVEQLVGNWLNPHWVTLRLLEGDANIIELIGRYIDLENSIATAEVSAL